MRRSRSRIDKRRSAARSLLVLVVALLIALRVATLALPALAHDLRHALSGTIFPDAATGGPAVVCRAGNPLYHVYNPGRLRVYSSCATATGRIVFILHAPDGDIHLSLLPDRGYWHLLDRDNYTHWGGTLVVEIIPPDRASVPVPALGAHVRVTGAYVTDLEHGWRELHPAWQIVPLS